jgi:hypothetical protein
MSLSGDMYVRISLVSVSLLLVFVTKVMYEEWAPALAVMFLSLMNISVTEVTLRWRLMYQNQETTREPQHEDETRSLDTLHYTQFTPRHNAHPVKHSYETPSSTVLEENRLVRRSLFNHRTAADNSPPKTNLLKGKYSRSWISSTSPIEEDADVYSTDVHPHQESSPWKTSRPAPGPAGFQSDSSSNTSSSSSEYFDALNIVLSDPLVAEETCQLSI